MTVFLSDLITCCDNL